MLNTDNINLAEIKQVQIYGRLGWHFQILDIYDTYIYRFVKKFVD